MPRTAKGQSTPRQVAYARRVFGGEGVSRKQIALDVGYPPSMANVVKQKIESTVGFNAAMMKLAADSNNVALAALHEFKVRGFTEFSNKDLVAALNAIGGAWAKFNGENRRKDDDEGGGKGNKLRTIVMQHIENQTMNNTVPVEAPKVEKSEPVKVVDAEEVDVDF